MNTVFVGGSRHVSHLPAPVTERLKNIVISGHQVVVGDATGADKAVQKFLAEVPYQKVTVFCSGDSYRHNLGKWPTRTVAVPKATKGFQFYAAKDREMAQEADFGLMIWDGKSPGTVLNVLRLIGAGKIAVMFAVPNERFITFKTAGDWHNFLAGLQAEFISELEARATPEEWLSLASQSPEAKTKDELTAAINAALVAGDTAAAIVSLGEMARRHGMSQVAKKAGLSRESLYRSLKSQGNPEFATVLKVIQALGLRLGIEPATLKRSSQAV
jgi:adenine-specific DNA-methyltransferase